MKITVRKVRPRLFGVGKLTSKRWTILRTDVSGLKLQLLYGSRSKAMRVARSIRNQ